MCGGYRNQYALMLKMAVFPVAGVIGRSNVSGLYGWNVYSPVRGYRWCSQPSPAGWKVFPVCGVIGGVVHGYPLAGSIPRVRGLSVVLSTVTRWLEVFPRMRGYRRYLTSSRKAQTYSPHAGLSAPSRIPLHSVSIPRMRGYRLLLAVGKTLLRIPRMRGYRRKRQPS